MTVDPLHLFLYALGTFVVLAGFAWSVGSFCFSRKIKQQKENEGFMTKKEFAAECQKQQENCPQMVIINNQLEQILEYSKKTATETKHLRECFLLYLSQTKIDEGVSKFIHEKLAERVKGVNI